MTLRMLSIFVNYKGNEITIEKYIEICHKLKKLKTNPIKDRQDVNVWTWNVNCIKNKVKLVNQLLSIYDIDVLVITETKITKSSEAIVIKQLDDDYEYVFNSNKNSYFHGTAFIYKMCKFNLVSVLGYNLPKGNVPDIPKEQTPFRGGFSPDHIISSTSLSSLQSDIEKGHSSEGRLIVVECTLLNMEKFIVVGAYVPCSGVDRKNPLKRLAYRTLSWDIDMHKYLVSLEKQYRRVIWLGDLNVIIKNNDIFNVDAIMAGTTKQEIENMRKFMINNNWIDTWDICNPDITECKKRATLNITNPYKLRFDHIICSGALKDNIVSSKIIQYYEGSDHAPIGTTFSI